MTWKWQANERKIKRTKETENERKNVQRNWCDSFICFFIWTAAFRSFQFTHCRFRVWVALPSDIWVCFCELFIISFDLDVVRFIFAWYENDANNSNDNGRNGKTTTISAVTLTPCENIFVKRHKHTQREIHIKLYHEKAYIFTLSMSTAKCQCTFLLVIYALFVKKNGYISRFFVLHIYTSYSGC